MYVIISNVIKSGNYELNDMLRKMDGNVWSPDAYPAGWEVYDG